MHGDLTSIEVVLYSHQDLRVVFQVVVAPVTDLIATTSDFMEHLHRIDSSVCFYVSVTFVYDFFFKERFILLHIF